MSFLQNIQLNNLRHDLNEIASEVATLQATVGGGGSGLVSDLDFNNHSATEINSIVFNDSKTLTSTTDGLEYDGSVISTADSGFITNNITTDINLNGHDVNNVVRVQFEDSQTDGNVYQMVTYTGVPAIVNTTNSDDVQLCLTVNETSGQHQNLALLNSSFTGVNSVVFNNYLALGTSGDDLQYNGNNVVDSSNIDSYLTTINGDISTLTTGVQGNKDNITTLQGTVSTIQGDITAIQGDITTINSNADDYLQTTAQTNLNMNGHDITGMSSLDMNAGYVSNAKGVQYNGHTLDISLGALTLDGVPYVNAGGGNNFGGNSLLGFGTLQTEILQFNTNAVNKNLTLNGTNDLIYDSNVILNNDNYQDYINVASWDGDATYDINLNNHKITNVDSIELTADNVIDVDTDNNLTYDTSLVVVRPLNNTVVNYDGLLDPDETGDIINSLSTFTTLYQNISANTYNWNNVTVKVDMSITMKVLNTTPTFTLSFDSQEVPSGNIYFGDNESNPDANMFVINSSAFTTVTGDTTLTISGTYIFDATTPTDANLLSNMLSQPDTGYEGLLQSAFLFKNTCESAMQFTSSSFIITFYDNTYGDLDVSNTNIINVNELKFGSNIVSVDGSDDLNYNSNKIITQPDLDSLNIITQSNLSSNGIITTNNIDDYVRQTFFFTSYSASGTDTQDITTPVNCSLALLDMDIIAYSLDNNDYTYGASKITAFFYSPDGTNYSVVADSVSVQDIAGGMVTGVTFKNDVPQLGYTMTFLNDTTYYKATYSYSFTERAG